MEFKVWVEGIQRVICGVTESTTCQDVVIALANAVGKTGRFTLIEKWRDNERFVAPTENPLKVVQKWGEYASDVQFILRHTDGQKHKSKSRKRSEKPSQNFTPGQEVRLSGSTNLKKSLTFSGGRSYSLPMKMNKVPSRVVAQPRCVPENSSLESLEEHSSFTSHSSQSSTSPYASFEGRPANKTSLGYGSLDRHRTHLSSAQYGSGSKGGVRTAFLSHNNNNKTPPHLSSNTDSSVLVPNHISTNSDSAITATAATATSSIASPTLPNGDVHVGAVLDSSNKQSKEELLKLVKLQQDKLSVQKSHLELMESEIQFWECREQEQQDEMKQLSTDMASLNARHEQQSQELEELDLVSWQDKLDLERSHEQTFQSELALVKSHIAKCESEMQQAGAKARSVSEELEKETGQQEKAVKDRQDEEMRVLQEISELQKQLNQRLVQYEDTQKGLEEVEGEVKTVDSDIQDRETQIIVLEGDLKKTNTDFFLTVTDTGQSEGEKAFVRPLRPGSARKLTHSPLLLKDFVATSKNPHGYWV